MDFAPDDFAKDIKIDKLALEEECVKQVDLYWFYADLVAEKKSQIDQLKNHLEVTTAQKELGFRNNPPNGMKVTESTIQALINSDFEVTEIKDNISAVQHKLYMAQAAVAALDQRKSELDNLVQLWIKSYYSNIQSTTGDKMHQYLNKE